MNACTPKGHEEQTKSEAPTLKSATITGGGIAPMKFWFNSTATRPKENAK